MILLDLMMPEMDGFEFLDALAARAEWREIPVIVITAKQLTAGERERLLRPGAQSDGESNREQGSISPQPSARHYGAGRRAKGTDRGQEYGHDKVLLVDDNEMNRDMLSRRLIRRGFEVIFAVDGKQGVDARAARESPILS